MEVDDSDGENMQQEDEELVAFSDFHSDEEGQGTLALVFALHSCRSPFIDECSRLGQCLHSWSEKIQESGSEGQDDSR